MSDLIDRQAAIDLFPNDVLEWDTNCGYIAPHLARQMIEKLPSAQPEPLTEEEINTIRIHMNAFKERLCNQMRWKEAEEYQRIIDKLDELASNLHQAIKFDATQVTRCKDCEYWNGSGKYCDYDMRGLEDDYCSWAKRKEE